MVKMEMIRAQRVSSERVSAQPHPLEVDRAGLTKSLTMTSVEPDYLIVVRGF